MLTYFIVLTWWMTSADDNQFAPRPRPVISVYDSAQAACSDDKKVKDLNFRAKSRIWQLEIEHKDCKSIILDVDFMSCLVGDKFKLKEGTCEPKQEFVFTP